MITKMVAEFRPLPCADDKPNPDVYQYRNGIFVLSLNMFFPDDPTPGNYSIDQLKGDISPIVYYRFHYGEDRPVCPDLLAGPVGGGGMDPILWQRLRVGLIMDELEENKEEADEDAEEEEDLLHPILWRVLH